jgi:hypothetical protein
MSSPSSADVFDESRDGISDAEFQSLIEGLQAEGATWFTERQLYARACAEDAIPSRVLGVLWLSAGLLSAVGFVVAFLSPFLGVPALAIVGGAAVMISMAIFMVAWLMPMPVPREATVRCWLDTWSKAGRSLPTLLQEPSLDNTPEIAPTTTRDGGRLERILIVEHDLMVDLLVRNGLHRDLDAVVVSEHGYPASSRAAAKEALRFRPGLPVLLLHDATDEGDAMHRRVQFGDLLPLRDRFLTDLGLAPHEVADLRELDPVSPRGRRNQVPLEMLPWKTLADALPDAVRTRTSLAHAIDMRRPKRRSSRAGWTA